MDIDELILKLIEENKAIESRLIEPICLKQCIKEIIVIINYKEQYLKVNCYTLDIIDIDEVSDDVRRSLFVKIEDKGIIRNSKRVERREFCNFLKMKYPETYLNMVFLDRESPDYLVFEENNQYAVEVVEATNSIESQFKTMCRLNTGRGKNKQEYGKYIIQKHKTNGNSFYVEELNGNIILSPHKGLVDTYMTRKQIVNAIVKKVRKYNEYDFKIKSKCILVFYSSIGFSNESDFNEVGKMISINEEIKKSEIKEIFITSNLYGTLVEYDKDGKTKKIIG